MERKITFGIQVGNVIREFMRRLTKQGKLPSGEGELDKTSDRDTTLTKKAIR
jgi:hypothetical protein